MQENIDKKDNKPEDRAKGQRSRRQIGQKETPRKTDRFETVEQEVRDVREQRLKTARTPNRTKK